MSTKIPIPCSFSTKTIPHLCRYSITTRTTTHFHSVTQFTNNIVSPKYYEFRDETKKKQKKKENRANIPTVLRHTYISQLTLCRCRTAHIIPAVITNFMQTLHFATQNAVRLLSRTLSLGKQKRINYSLRTERAQVLGRIYGKKEKETCPHAA